MDVEALQRRVASSRDNWIVREGDIVTHYDTVRRAVRRRTIAMYWNSLAHTPKYVNRVTAEAAADVGGCFRA